MQLVGTGKEISAAAISPVVNSEIPMMQYSTMHNVIFMYSSQ